MRQQSETPGGEPGGRDRSINTFYSSLKTRRTQAARRLNVLGWALLDVVLWVAAALLWREVFQ